MKKENNLSVKKENGKENGNISNEKEKHFLSKKNFNIALKKAGYTQKTLSEDIYISYTTISKWISETNPQPITDNNLLRLARQLYVSKDFLLGKINDSSPEIHRIYNKHSERNKSESDFIEYLGFEKTEYREYNGKYYSMLINKKDGNWKYCDADFLNFLEDQIISFGYNLLDNYFNSEMVNTKNEETLKEIEEDRNKLYNELWGCDFLKSSNAILTKDSKEFKEDYEIIEEHPEYEAEEIEEREDEIYYKIKGSWIKASEVPAALTEKAIKKKPTEEQLVNQKRIKRLIEKYSQDDKKKE